MKRSGVVFCLALLAALPSLASAQQPVAIPSATPDSLAGFLRRQGVPTTVSGELYLPAGAKAPMPAMVLKHGSGGLNGAYGANIRKWAATLNGWGIAALLVDSFAPRHIGSTGTDQGQLSTWADVTDALNGLKFLGGDPRFDKRRIGIIGWSRGGSIALETALEAVRRSVIPDDLKFAAHVVFYGAAEIQYRDRASDQSPMLFLHGESDNYVPMAPTREFADWMHSLGNPMSFVAYPNTYHDFDVEGVAYGSDRSVQVSAKCDLVMQLPDGRILRMNHVDNPGASVEQVRAYLRDCGTKGAFVGYNAAARADAVEKVHAFLKQYLGAN